MREIVLRGLIVAALFLMEAISGSVRTVDAQQNWQSKWEETVQAAKKEGQVTILVSYDAFLQEFKREYPEIKVVSVTGKGSVLYPRIMAERRAGKNLADVMISGAFPPYPEMHAAKILDPIPPALILPAVKDTSKWFEGKHEYVDHDGKYVFLHTSNPRGGSASYNTKLVDPAGFKSYRDFLDPKWKGKMVAFDPQAGRSQIRFLYFNPKLGPKYLRQLFGGMDITISRNRRQPVDWLSVGKYYICLFCQRITVAKSQGLPVDQMIVRWKEGIDMSAKGYGALSLINRHPHPNAAKVFINWFLSPKGQLAFQRSFHPADAPNSRRVDISKDYLPVTSRREKGVKYINMEQPEWLKRKADVTNFVKKVLRESGKL